MASAFLEYTSRENIPDNRIYSLVHRCKKCSYITKSLFFIRKHIKRHKSSTRLELFECSRNTLEIFLCKECNFQTYETVAFNNHIKDHHLSRKIPGTNVPNPAESLSSVLNEDESRDESNRNFSSEDLIRRLTIRRDKSRFKKISDVKIFACDKCFYKTRKETYLEYHVCKNELRQRKHKTEVKDKQKCVERIECHVINIHTHEEDTWVKCNKCMFTAKNKYLLRSHVVYKHSPDENIKWFHCDTCSYKAKGRGNLRQHIMYNHTSVENFKWFQCDKCPYKTKHSARLLKRHILTKHTPLENVKLLQCEKCSYNTVDKQNLKAHIHVKHTPEDSIKWFQCDKCSYKSKFKGHVKGHINNKHTPVEDITWFKCDKCSYKSKDKQCVKYHTATKHW